MKKEDYIRKYGEAAYKKKLEQTRAWHRNNIEKGKETGAAWYKDNLKKVAISCAEQYHKGGKYYGKRLIKEQTGLRGERNKVRKKHARFYLSYKQIIDPLGLSQLHHQWLPKTADYKGVALVEAYQHQYGYIDVIQILEGEITLFTEAEIRGDK